MPRYRAMYDVLGDLVLPRGADALALQGRSCEVRLRNAKAGDDGHVHKLEATVIGTSESMEESVQELRTALAEVLDLVSFTTQSRFQVSGCRSVIEWDDNLRERQMFSIHYSDARLPPSPELHGGVGDTVNELLKLDAPDFITAAFSAYRKGCIATLKEDQFMSFFRVVELVAEHRVEKQRVPLRCAACKGALECPSCGEEATRTPFGRAAIDSLIKGVTGEEDPKLSKVLFGFRNGLTHGRRVKSIEKEYGVA